MNRPKIYKKDGWFYCELKGIQAKGKTVREAFFNFVILKATSNLHEGEVEL